MTDRSYAAIANERVVALAAAGDEQAVAEFIDRGLASGRSYAGDGRDRKATRADERITDRSAWWRDRLGNFNSERHDPDSVFFDNSYTGYSELELGGGCTRCGCPDECLCHG